MKKMNLRRNILTLLLTVLIFNVLNAQCDTCNRVDTAMKKYGWWQYFYDTLRTEKFLEGGYVDGQKQGLWKEFYRNGKIKSEITYLNNVPSGTARLYYENGNPSEQGTWNSFGWVGEYKSFYPDGQLARELNYGENTLRSGIQRYYSESGRLMMSGYWENGAAEGLVAEYYDSGKPRRETQWIGGRLHGSGREYYETGSLKAEFVYSNGVYDPSSLRTFRRQEERPVVAAIENPVEKTVVKDEPDKTEQPGYEIFRGTGYHKLYYENKRIDREGYFIDGHLDSGKRYYYNSKGQLIKTAIYEHGKIVNIIDN